MSTGYKRSRSTYKSSSKKMMPYKKKRKFTKSGDVSSVSSSKTKITLIKRHVDGFTQTVNNLTGLQGAITFRLSNVPGVTDFTNLYDEYKICGVKVRFIPRTNMANTSLLAGDVPPYNARFLSAVDFNDNSPPTNADEIRQYENCKVTPLLVEHERYIDKPLFLNTTGQNVNDWISTGSATTLHYGMKYFVEPTNTSAAANNFTYTIELIYYLCFRNIK